MSYICTQIVTYEYVDKRQSGPKCDPWGAPDKFNDLKFLEYLLQSLFNLTNKTKKNKVIQKSAIFISTKQKKKNTFIIQPGFRHFHTVRIF